VQVEVNKITFTRIGIFIYLYPVYAVRDHVRKHNKVINIVRIDGEERKIKDTDNRYCADAHPTGGFNTNNYLMML